MICREMKAIVKNVEHEDSESKYIVAKAFALDNMLWYYGRYDTPEKAKQVAEEITQGDVIGVVLIDDATQIRDIKESINCAEEMKRFNAEKYKEKFTAIDSLKIDSSAYDKIKEIVGK